jgi:hypothetical protein
MSVLVKGMKMPKLYETYKVNFAMTNDGKIVMEMCPLNETGYRLVGEVVALPDHHGRLIDADALEPDADYDDGEFWAYSVAQVCNAPTIVEKES